MTGCLLDLAIVKLLMRLQSFSSNDRPHSSCYSNLHSKQHHLRSSFAQPKVSLVDVEQRAVVSELDLKRLCTFGRGVAFTVFRIRSLIMLVLSPSRPLVKLHWLSPHSLLPKPRQKLLGIFPISRLLVMMEKEVVCVPSSSHVLWRSVATRTRKYSRERLIDEKNCGDRISH